MTPEAQRIAIGEACGATWGHPVFNHDHKWHVHFGRDPFEFDASWAGKPPPFEQCVQELDIPDYLNDLNAMHEAENVLTEAQWTDYANILTDLVPCSRKGMIHATAAQRAEAFLRTIGKWIES